MEINFSGKLDGFLTFSIEEILCEYELLKFLFRITAKVFQRWLLLLLVRRKSFSILYYKL